MKRGIALHCYHDSLFAYVYDYDERVRYIKENKPESEQKLRLKLLQLVPEDRIPGRDSLEWESLDKACEALGKACEDRNLESYKAIPC